MFSKLILSSLILFISFSSMASMSLTLSELKSQEQRTFDALMNSQISLHEKIQILQATKDLAEESIRAAIVDGTANPSDIVQPETEIAQAFQTVDVLTVLSQLHIENDRISSKSCSEAKAMIQLALINNGEERAPSSSEAKTIAVLKALCK